MLGDHSAKGSRGSPSLLLKTLGGWPEGLGRGGSWPMNSLILPARAVEPAPDEPPVGRSTAYAARPIPRVPQTLTPLPEHPSLELDPVPSPSLVRSHFMDMQQFLTNRAQFPPEELAKYAGKYVAWSPDGTQIVASDEDPLR